MDTIHVDKLMNNTLNFLMESLTRTEAHAGQLLAKTGDTDGYREVLAHINELRAIVTEYREDIS